MSCASPMPSAATKAEPLGSLSTAAPSCASGAPEELSDAAAESNSRNSSVEPPDFLVEKLFAVSARGQVLMRCGSSAAFARISARPPQQALLGSGAWGHVWRAQDGRGRLVAVKQTSQALAERERKALEVVGLRPHACVLRLLYAVVTPGVETGALILEYCARGDMESIIAAAGRGCGGCYVRPQAWAHWLAQTFLALEHLHCCCDLLHLDVKPGNLFIDERDKLKLGDFGASHRGSAADGAWVLGVPPGSPGFVAPEIFRQEPFGPKADLYSFGALVWMLLTGKGPPTRVGVVDGSRFHMLGDDYQLLTSEIRMCDRDALPEHAADFVLSLIDRRPELRPEHRAIRAHGLAAAWRLPALDDARALEGWLGDTAQTRPGA